MKLSDVMSAAGLSAYAEIGLVLFLGAFLAVAYSLYAHGRPEDWAARGRLPFDDGDDHRG